jgi:hypothetical protein
MFALRHESRASPPELRDDRIVAIADVTSVPHDSRGCNRNIGYSNDAQSMNIERAGERLRPLLFDISPNDITEHPFAKRREAVALRKSVGTEIESSGLVALHDRLSCPCHWPFS